MEQPITHRIDDKEPTYEELKNMVGGYIELAYDDGNTQIICNEEGKIHGLPVNEEATKEWANQLGKHSFYEMPDILVGDCVILTGEALMK